jgi:hypothetical protein
MTTTDGSSVGIERSQGRALGLVGTMALVVLIRAIILAVGITSIEVAPPGLEPHENYERPWVAWDARHYHEIAVHGYSPDTVGRPYREHTTFNLIAYFPLVPMVARGMALLMPVWVGLVTFSNLCSLIAFAFTYDWARRMTNSRLAMICVLLIAVFPGAVAFAAGQSDGPFFLMTSMTLWLLQQRNFYFAAVVAAFATFTRPTGVAVAMVIPLYAWPLMKSIPFSRRAMHFIALGAISGSGLLLYEAFLWHRYQSPTAYFDAQKLWKQLDTTRVTDDESQGVKRYSFEFFKERLLRPQTWNRGLAVLLLIITVVGLIRPGPIPRVIFLIPLIILLMTCVPDKGLRVSSLPRYESAAAPLFLLVGLWLANQKRFSLLMILLVAQLAVQIYYAWLFPREIWVG